MEVMAVLSDRIRAAWRCIAAAGEDKIPSYYMAFPHKYCRTVVSEIVSSVHIRVEKAKKGKIHFFSACILNHFNH